MEWVVLNQRTVDSENKEKEGEKRRKKLNYEVLYFGAFFWVRGMDRFGFHLGSELKYKFCCQK